jgi:hypothetical protein
MTIRKRFPWTTKTDDFSVPGLHSKPSAAYFLMIRALRISPSYELARKVRAGEITSAEKKKLPKDFDQVLATYDLIGDIDKIIFRYWWLKRGIAIFGTPYNEPQLGVIDIFSAGQEIDFADLNKRVKKNLQKERAFEGSPPTILLTIPLNLEKTAIIRKIKFLLKEIHIELPKTPAEPLIKLMHKRLNRKATEKGLNLLYRKSANPEMELWRLGARAKISETYSPVLDYKGPRKPKDATEISDRIILSKITHRTLKRFEFIVENAARGKFPCDDPIEIIEFNYQVVKEKHESFNKWLNETEDRWKKQLGVS